MTRKRRSASTEGAAPAARRRLMPLFKGGVAVAVMLSAAAGVSAGYDAADDRHYFDVTTLTVRGNGILGSETVAALAGPVIDRNIFEIDLDAMGRRIEAHPWIRDVSIRRDLPDRLTVEVRERRPAVMVEAAGRLWLTDAEGMVLGEAEDRERYGLPVVGGVAPAEGLAPGATVPVASLRPALAAAEALEGFRLMGQGGVDRIEVGEGELTLTFHGTPVRVVTPRESWGDAAARLRTVSYLLSEEPAAVDSIDLRFADRAVVTRRGTEDTGHEARNG